MFWLLLLQNVFSNKTSLEDLYLIPPYINGKGISSVVNLMGENSILSHGSDQHIKLAYMSPNSAGALVYRNQLGIDKFLIEIKLNISDLKYKGQENHGILIFFTKSDNVEIGDFYGIKGDCDFAVALDIKEGLDVNIKVFVNNKMQKSVNYRFFEEDDVKIRIKQGDKLEVEADDTYDNVVVYDSDKYFINKMSFLGISASNGENTEASFALRSVEFSNIKIVPKYFERGEREGNNKLTMVVFIISIGGIIYYLYNQRNIKRV
ncbi:VIP36-like protein [Vairimorpha necatrix]|uniref:VIP36-like protein n=1 Tax=Vairimorpha necatrix TaxID=6039 RepID=A0AAX4JCR3_9MICR